MKRVRFVISPTMVRLAGPAILAWICRMLRLVDVASSTIALTNIELRLGERAPPRHGGLSQLRYWSAQHYWTSLGAMSVKAGYA